jgi:hypothetical protein
MSGGKHEKAWEKVGPNVSKIDSDAKHSKSERAVEIAHETHKPASKIPHTEPDAGHKPAKP